MSKEAAKAASEARTSPWEMVRPMGRGGFGLKADPSLNMGSSSSRGIDISWSDNAASSFCKAPDLVSALCWPQLSSDRGLAILAGCLLSNASKAAWLIAYATERRTKIAVKAWVSAVVAPTGRLEILSELTFSKGTSVQDPS